MPLVIDFLCSHLAVRANRPDLSVPASAKAWSTGTCVPGDPQDGVLSDNAPPRRSEGKGAARACPTRCMRCQCSPIESVGFHRPHRHAKPIWRTWRLGVSSFQLAQAICSPLTLRRQGSWRSWECHGWRGSASNSQKLSFALRSGETMLQKVLKVQARKNKDGPPLPWYLVPTCQHRRASERR